MKQKLTLTIFLVITAFAFLLTEKTNAQTADDAQFIKTEIKGVLHFQNGRGYFISVASSEFPKKENQVWLRVGENKKFVRELEGLLNKTVIAKGELEQLPESVTASVPPRAMYIYDFQIEEIKTKQ